MPRATATLAAPAINDKGGLGELPTGVECPPSQQAQFFDKALRRPAAAPLRNSLETEMRQAARTFVDLLRNGALSAEISDLVALADAGVLGAASAEIDRTDGLQLVPLGDAPLHLIVAVVEHGELIDLIGFRSSRPDRWGMRTGSGGLLGWDAVERAIASIGWGLPISEITLHLHQNPLEWLRARGTGACVIDGWRTDTCVQLRGLARIEVASPAVARAVGRKLTPPPPRIPIITIEGGHNAARTPA